MPKIPLPALKPNEEGGYTFCPKCALMWGALILIAVSVYFYAQRRKGKL